MQTDPHLHSTGTLKMIFKLNMQNQDGKNKATMVDKLSHNSSSCSANCVGFDDEDDAPSSPIQIDIGSDLPEL